MSKLLAKLLLLSTIGVNHCQAFMMAQHENGILIDLRNANECTQDDLDYLARYAEQIDKDVRISFINASHETEQVGMSILQHLMDGFDSNKYHGKISITSVNRNFLSDAIQIANANFSYISELSMRTLHFQVQLPKTIPFEAWVT